MFNLAVGYEKCGIPPSKLVVVLEAIERIYNHVDNHPS
jgi:hypothetical protein